MLRKYPRVEASLDPSLDERHAADEPAVSLVVVDNYRQRARISIGYEPWSVGYQSKGPKTVTTGSNNGNK